MLRINHYKKKELRLTSVGLFFLKWLFDFDIYDEKLVNEFVSDILKSAPKLSSDDIEGHKRRTDTRLWCHMDLIQELWLTDLHASRRQVSVQEDVT